MSEVLSYEIEDDIFQVGLYIANELTINTFVDCNKLTGLFFIFQRVIYLEPSLQSLENNEMQLQFKQFL